MEEWGNMNQVFIGNVGALASAPIFPGLRTCFDAAFHEIWLLSGRAGREYGK
jgi:hypothetical protein